MCNGSVLVNCPRVGINIKSCDQIKMGIFITFSKSLTFFNTKRSGTELYSHDFLCVSCQLINSHYSDQWFHILLIGLNVIIQP